MGWLTGEGKAANGARTVAMGEIAVADPGERLQCVGLGSCLAIVAYDPGAEGGRGLAAIAHVVLPRPLGRDGAREGCRDGEPPPAKYSSDAVRNLGSALVARGSDLDGVRIALVGGAQLLAGSGAPGFALPQLGQRNVEEARLGSRAFGFVVVAEEVGGTLGRAVTVDAATGVVTVRTTLGGTKHLCCLRDEPREMTRDELRFGTEPAPHAPRLNAGDLACAA